MRIKVLKDPGPPTNAFPREMSDQGHSTGHTLNTKQCYTEDLLSFLVDISPALHISYTFKNTCTKHIVLFFLLFFTSCSQGYILTALLLTQTFYTSLWAVREIVTSLQEIIWTAIVLCTNSKKKEVTSLVEFLLPYFIVIGWKILFCVLWAGVQDYAHLHQWNSSLGFDTILN